MVLRSPLAIVVLALVSMPLMHLAQGSNPDVEGFIQRWDADHDEAISRDELRNATGDRLDQLIDKMFHAIDKNHDGKLDKHELKTITGESLFWLFETRQRPAS
jgi:hypothetical protein